MVRCILFFLVLATNLLVEAQTKTIARLKKAVESAASSEEKLNALFALCEQGYSLHPDTLMYYALLAEAIAKDQGDRPATAEAIYYKSYSLTNKGLIDSSLHLAQQCLGILEKDVKKHVLLANIWNQQGRCYMRKNQYREAIDRGYKVISEAEKANDTLLLLKGNTLIGWAYLEMGQLKEALSWHLRALHTTADTNLVNRYSVLYGNLAINYMGLNQPDSALYFIKKAVNNARQYENLFALSNALAMEAQIYVRTGQSALAEEPLKETISIRNLIGDPFYIVSDMAQLATYYAHNKQAKKGIILCKEGIELAHKYKLATKLFFLYGALAENYKAINDMPNYTYTLEKIIALKDSVYGANSADALAEMQTKYDVQKKENIIMQQRLRLTQKSYLLYGALTLLLFIVALSYLLFIQYKRRQKTRFEIMQLEEKQKAQLAVVQAEEAERKRIAADLHDTLGAYAASIMNNVDQLQTSTENQQPVLHQLRQNTQAIVTQLSDTIWALKKDTQSLTAISDRIKVFVQSLLPNYPGITIDVIEEINYDFLLPPAQAYNLFQIVKEAVINALRHSGCTKITVHLAAKDNWMIRIIDDGCGFISDLALLSGKGYGLNNMKQRSTESGWKITWQKAHKGTVVQIMPDTN
jgi:signal transduction histidine kinase